MKKLLTAWCVLAFSFAYGQENLRCYTTEIYRQRIHDHPEVLENRRLLEEHIVRATQRTGTGSNHTTGQVYVIPIVFHIIHNYGGENISDAQVQDQVRILNDDYRKTSYDTASIVPAFKPIAADCEIEFRLANLDPNGNCTNGIDRIPSLLTYQADDNAKLNPWPDDQYLNVWVVASLSWSGVAAYAYYPGTAPPGADGVIMLSHYVGSIGSGSSGQSRVLTHEIGHYLNLAHVWGDTNDPGVACGDDNVSDTPITMGWTTCNVNGATCGNLIDNVQNYMEYSYCCKMFTLGQKARMRATLTSSIGGRNNLWNTANLTATGTDGLFSQTCVPIADFSVNYTSICAGDSVQYKDLSWNGRPTAWNWSFPGGVPSVSTDSSPTVYYGSTGQYNATLKSLNAAGADSITKNLILRVNGPSTQTYPYFQGFETAGSFPEPDGYIINADGGNTWHRVSNAGSTGVASIMINNFSGNSIGSTDEYITPSFNLSGTSSLTFNFKVAYATTDTTLKDKLQVAVSTDCGKTWNVRYSKAGYGLETRTPTGSYFIPNASQWRQETVNINPFRNEPDVRFRFQNTCAGGNNLYIDDINITGIITGVDEASASRASFNVFPNPSSGNFSVLFDLSKAGSVQLKITDAIGRTLQTITHADLQPGLHQYPVNNPLAAGIYFVVLEREGEVFTKKLVVTKN